MSEDKYSVPIIGSPFAGLSVHPLYGTTLLAGEAELDFVLDGPLPLAWQRTYRSGNAESGWLGRGWTVPLSRRLDIEENAIVFVDEQGRRTLFPLLEVNERHYSSVAQITLMRTDVHEYELHTPEYLHLLFAPADALEPARQLLLQRLADLNNHVIEFTWRADGLPDYLLDSTGRKLQLYFEGRRLTQVREMRDLTDAKPASGGARSELLVAYRYNAEGDLSAVLDSVGNVVRTFTYQQHMLVEHAEPGGIISRYEWDRLHAQGRVIRNTLNTGELWSYAYDEIAGLTTVTDAGGRCRTYHFDGEKRLIGITDASGGIAARKLDPLGRLIAEIDPAGNTAHYAYDERGDITCMTDAGGGLTRIEYHPLWRKPIAVIDAMGRTSRYAYDDRSNLIAQTAADGAVTRYQLNEHGLPVIITDASGGIVKLNYDHAQRLTRHTDSSGHSTHYAYDRRGNLVGVTDANGWRSEYCYQSINRRDRLVAVKHPSSGEERYTYDKLGRLIAHQDALGHVTQYTRDIAGRLSQRSNALGHSLRYGYDVHGRLISLHNENNITTRFAYDILDRLIAEQGFDGKRIDYRYNAAGHLLERIDNPSTPHVIRTRYRRDRQGRLLAKIALKRLSDTRDQMHFVSTRNRYAYDQAGQLIFAANAAATVELQYDAAGRLLREATLARTGRYSVLEHRYDLLGNRIQTLLPDGRCLDLLRYGSGHVHQINLDGIVVCDIDRNDLHQEVRRSQGALESRYQYDGMGRLLSSHSYPADQESNPLHPIHSPINNPVNNPQAGNAHLRRRPAAPSGSHIARRYEYNAAGQLESILDNLHGSTHYLYDPVGRLLAALHGTLCDTFAFDPAHNLLDPECATAGSRPRKTGFTQEEWRELVKCNIGNPEFSPLQARDDCNHPDTWNDVKANQIKVYEDKSYAYDTYGNTVEKKIGTHTVQHFLWDAEHRLIQAAISREDRTQTFQYAYDPFGRRIAKQDDSGTSYFSWDGNRILLEARGQQQRLYIYQPDSFIPLAQVNLCAGMPNGGTESSGGRQAAALAIYHYHTDQLGTPREMTDSSGQIRWSAIYKAWGNTLKVVLVEDGQTPDAGPIVQALRFQGQYFDSETGLHYNRFRYYDPDVGRYISQDPIGLGGGHNLYQYALNPTGRVEPLGLNGLFLLTCQGSTDVLSTMGVLFAGRQLERPLRQVLDLIFTPN